MNPWPVIVRELRAEARRFLNTGLRVLAASQGEAGTIHCVPLPALRLRYTPVAIVYTVFFGFANVFCYLTLFLMAFTFHRAWFGTDHARLGPVGGFLSTLPEMGLIVLDVIGILQGLFAWRYITLMNRQLSRSLLAGEIR